MDFQANRTGKLSDDDLSFPRPGMLMDIGQSRLGDTIEHGPLRAVQLFDAGKSGEVGVNFRPFGKVGDEGLEGGNQPQVVQHGGAQFAGETMDDIDRFFHQPLGMRDVPAKIPGVARGFARQGGEVDIDAHEGLDDFVMQLPADALAFLFLGQQQLVGQMPQLFLEVKRLLK